MTNKHKIVKISFTIDLNDRDKIRNVIIKLKELIKILTIKWQRTEP